MVRIGNRVRDAAALTGSVAGAILLAVSSVAQSPGAKDYDIGPQDLGPALSAVASASGLQLVANGSLIAGKRSAAVHGHLTPQEALEAVLAGTDLSAKISGETIIIRGRSDAAVAAAGAAPQPEILVTGSRLRGATVASPVITLSRESIEQGGFSDLGGAMRALPQNFSGGQNPGVGSGAAGGGFANGNATGGSAVNLRGLGPDATLTLLNGHRLSYSSFSQAVDISAIPVGAVDRVEVVPDGASALYGSDAVAGVVNVILRPSFDGITTTARVGGATEGGDLQQQYGLVAGTHWQGGGIFGTYNYEHDASLKASDRSYTDYLGSPYDLTPGQTDHSGIVSARQNIGSFATLKLDALFNRRSFVRTISAYGEIFRTAVVNRTFTVAPELDLHVSGAWTVAVSGNYGINKNRSSERDTYAGQLIYDGVGCDCNALNGVEMNAEGPIVHLPAGDLRAALGAGYRHADYDLRNLGTGVDVQREAQRDIYLYGEISVPLASPAGEHPFLYHLSLTAAARYENYNRFGGITTPKLGIVYSPSRDIDIKGSWGRSFKAPTLSQLSTAENAYLIPATAFAGLAAPAGAAILFLQGGSPDLRPERSRSWTTTLSIHPARLRHLTVDLTYFDVRYTQRVLAPIGYYPNAFNPIYADYVHYSPDAAEQAGLIALAPNGLQNQSGSAYDPGSVYAYVDNNFTNVARQKIDGVDASVNWRLPAGGSTWSLSLEASWLNSRQQNLAGQPYFDLSGTAWNPPRLHMRDGLGWERGGLRTFAFVNYLEGVEDTRTLPSAHGHSMTTVDLTAEYAFDKADRLTRGLELSFAAFNLFNRRPPYLAPAPYVEPYDSTNYSAVGRFVQFTVSKHF